jgi:uncharacterized protein (TIGR02246 family)
MTTATTNEATIVLDQLYNAWAAGDADAFVACFTPDATSIVPGSVADGRAAIHQRMATRFAGPLAGTRVTDEVIGVRYLGTDAAVLVSRSAVVPAGADAPPDGGWVIATWTLHRQDGKWLIAAYHNCPA